MKSHVYQVDGKSMSPYLYSGESILFEELSEAPQIGDILLIQTQGKRKLIHRCIGKNCFKGDALKRFDHEYGFHLENLKKAKGRFLKVGTEYKYIPFSNFFHLLIAKVSKYNHANNKIAHRFFSFLTKIIGKLCRQFENARG